MVVGRLDFLLGRLLFRNYVQLREGTSGGYTGDEPKANWILENENKEWSTQTPIPSKEISPTEESVDHNHSSTF